jgi:hypothetical protein
LTIEAARRLDQSERLRPLDLAIEAERDPAPTTDVRWDLVELGLAVDEHLLHARRRTDDQHEHAVAMMVVPQRRELLLADEPCRRAVAEALGHIVEREAR